MRTKYDLIGSESIGAENGYASRGKYRSLDPAENRYCYYYEPDDEHWNAYEYGWSAGSRKRDTEERNAASNYATATATH